MLLQFSLNVLRIVEILLLLQVTIVFASQNCERKYQLAANQSARLVSNRGPPCQIQITAPEDYEIAINCNVSIPRTTNGCTTDYFYVNTDGSTNLTGSTVYCGTGVVKALSLFRTIVIGYTTTRNVDYGSYICLVQAEPQPCDCGWSIDTKIVGGTEAKLNEFPFMVGLVSARDRFIFCGGSIISHHYVLSAAHCFQLYNNVAELAVLVGEHNISTAAESPYTAIHLVKSVEINEFFSGFSNDIALVATVTSMEWSRGVGPACLPFLYEFAEFTGAQVEIAGWGTTSFGGRRSDVLMKANTNIISNAYCRYTFSDLESSVICTYARDSDTCQYDSGGPLILQYDRLFVIGIVSYGRGCAINLPAVNVRVTSYLNWIQNRTGEQFCRKR